MMREEDAQSRDNDDVNDKDSHDDRVKVVFFLSRVRRSRVYYE
jgi:hypothetical protein